MRPTYHLAPAETWATSDPNRPYAPASLIDEGFIHCTDGMTEMVATANRHYREDPRAFLVLTVDLDAASSPWRIEDERGIYPHIHGAIDRAAITRVVPAPRADDGEFLAFEA
jgi:uncharacterized protein (DUF952 family)